MSEFHCPNGKPHHWLIDNYNFGKCKRCKEGRQFNPKIAESMNPNKNNSVSRHVSRPKDDDGVLRRILAEQAIRNGSSDHLTRFN